MAEIQKIKPEAKLIKFEFFSGSPENAKKIKSVEAPEGSSILEVAHNNDVDLEGACDGSLACSTCHVILDNETYSCLPKPTVEEEDMLDFAFGVTNTSRLGCQVRPTLQILHGDSIKIYIPVNNRNL